MEDFKLILYILAIVAYFIYNAWRKAFNSPGEEVAPPKERKRPQQDQPAPRSMPLPKPPPQQPRPQRPMAPATSFEDILREMQSKMERANEQHRPSVEEQKPVYKPTPRPVVTEPAPAPALSLEIPEQARIYDQQVRARRSSNVPDTSFKEPAAGRANPYAALLRNPQSARDAFVLSEIFNRKHF